MNKEFLRINDAAEFLGITKKALYIQVSRGNITPLRRGKLLYFKQSYLRSLIEGEV
ncbi:helix-turn-helix domain-containing protein [Olivibacter sp. SDN3]|uniref:helix-turn-helix domain-containing protein n=1 Tax=Olivibacter sp. SDN3 TaxID=2764720 RepID=UPI0016510853|nr:helix-turn-helix domain-containing protein [Olivibacter sp. SDN3]QNL49247.1 helix-turn-helix domain-containing protein [Olivibacter sp. SDN3]